MDKRLQRVPIVNDELKRGKQSAKYAIVSYKKQSSFRIIAFLRSLQKAQRRYTLLREDI